MQWARLRYAVAGCGPRLHQRRQGATLDTSGIGFSPEQTERLGKIHSRLVEARRELDALIGDAYLRPRASIVPVHFLDLASAVEKLRWAEKEWRELEQEIAKRTAQPPDESIQVDDKEPHLRAVGNRS